MDVFFLLSTAFPKWGGLCDSGKKQSPINLHVKGALKGEFDALKFENYDEHQKNLRMVNNGHSSELENNKKKSKKIPFNREILFQLQFNYLASITN